MGYDENFYYISGFRSATLDTFATAIKVAVANGQAVMSKESALKTSIFLNVETFPGLSSTSEIFLTYKFSSVYPLSKQIGFIRYNTDTEKNVWGSLL